jgi:hypothetical protein
MGFPHRAACLSALALISLTGTAAAAATSPTATHACGDIGEDGQPTSGALVLDEALSTPAADFKDQTGDKTLQLVFKVGGCTLKSTAGIKVRVSASDANVAKSLGKGVATPKGTVLTVEVPVAATFPAGEHTALILISGPTILTVTQRVTVKRKQPWPLPLAIAALAGALGLLWAAWMAFLAAGGGAQGKRVDFTPAYLTVAVVAAGGAVYAVLLTAYITPADWAPGIGPDLSLGVAAASASAGAATTAALAKAIHAAVKRRRKPGVHVASG